MHHRITQQLLATLGNQDEGPDLRQPHLVLSAPAPPRLLPRTRRAKVGRDGRVMLTQRIPQGLNEIEIVPSQTTNHKVIAHGRGDPLC